MDMDIIPDIIKANCACKLCGGSVELIKIASQYVGVASVYSLNCEACNTAKRFQTSRKMTCGLYEVNLRLVHGLRSIGKGVAARSVLCAILNLPIVTDKVCKV